MFSFLKRLTQGSNRYTYGHVLDLEKFRFIVVRDNETYYVCIGGLGFPLLTKNREKGLILYSNSDAENQMRDTLINSVRIAPQNINKEFIIE